MINSELVKTVDRVSDDAIASTVTYGGEIIKVDESSNYFHVVDDAPIIPSITTMSCSDGTTVTDNGLLKWYDKYTKVLVDIINYTKESEIN